MPSLYVPRYFSLQATEPLGMGDKVRVEIELGICDERGPRPDSFVAAQEIAYHRMIEACRKYMHVYVTCDLMMCVYITINLQ